MPSEPNVRQPETAAPTPPLRTIFLYVTDECNQRCPHCWINPNAEGRSQVERPSLDDYFRFVRAAQPLGLQLVKFTGGEPLLKEDTFRIIEHNSLLGVRSSLETNAMLVGRKEAEFLKKHRVHVGVSLDGASSDVHDRRRGFRGAFDRTWPALEMMTELGIPLTIVSAVSYSNLEEIPKILELLRGLKRNGPLYSKINPILPLGRARKMGRRGDTLAVEDLLRLASEVSEKLNPEYREYGISVMLQLELAFFPIEGLARGAGQTGVYNCGFLNLISALADGSITFCGVGYQARELTMGNIRGDYDLPSLWRSHPLLQDVRFKVHEALDGVCGQCLFRQTCLGGCRASALMLGGSLAASPPSCQALYDSGLFPVTRLREPEASRYSARAREHREVAAVC